MKAKIFIYNENEPFDQRAYICIDIPAVIPKGSVIYLSEEDQNDLLKKITASHEVAEMYDIFNMRHSLILSKIGETAFKNISLQSLRDESRIDEFVYVYDIGYEYVMGEYATGEYMLCISLNK